MSNEANEAVVSELEHLFEENKKLRAQLTEAIAFLDRMAGRIENWPPGASRYQFEPTAADCRAKARELRGEASPPDDRIDPLDLRRPCDAPLRRKL